MGDLYPDTGVVLKKLTGVVLNKLNAGDLDFLPDNTRYGVDDLGAEDLFPDAK